MTLGDRIKVWREKKGWGQRELARQARLDVSWISRLESGERANISLEAAARLARALGVSTDYLAGIPDTDREHAALVHLSLPELLALVQQLEVKYATTAQTPLQRREGDDPHNGTR
jgi:transcriptional regulator with XRE-family HTH domain